MKEEHESIRNEDFRFQALTTLSEDWISPDTGIKHDAGESVMLTALISRGDSIFSFGIPNTTALFLNFSYKLWQESSLFFKDENFENVTSEHVQEKTIYPKVHSDLFDFMEKRMGSIVFAYSALESFANEYIPNEYIFEKERFDAKCTEKYTKNQIERNLNLDIKLGEILPVIFKIKSPRGKAVWSQYKALQHIRDRVIHLKSDDRRSTKVDDSTIWKELLNERHHNVALHAKNMVGYFLENTKDKPRWLKNFPY